MAKQNKKPSKPPKKSTPKKSQPKTKPKKTPPKKTPPKKTPPKKTPPKKKGQPLAAKTQTRTPQLKALSNEITMLASIDVPTVAWNNNPLSATVSAHVVLDPATEMFKQATLTCKDNTSGVSVGAATPMGWTPATSTALAPNAFAGKFVSGHSYKFTVVVEYQLLQQKSASVDKQAP